MRVTAELVDHHHHTQVLIVSRFNPKINDKSAPQILVYLGSAPNRVLMTWVVVSSVYLLLGVFGFRWNAHRNGQSHTTYIIFHFPPFEVCLNTFPPRYNFSPPGHSTPVSPPCGLTFLHFYLSAVVDTTTVWSPENMEELGCLDGLLRDPTHFQHEQHMALCCCCIGTPCKNL